MSSDSSRNCFLLVSLSASCFLLSFSFFGILRFHDYISAAAIQIVNQTSRRAFWLYLVLRFEEDARRYLETPSGLHQGLFTLLARGYTQSIVCRDEREVKRGKFMRMWRGQKGAEKIVS